MDRGGTYRQELNNYVNLLSDYKNKNHKMSIYEHHFECLNDWNKFHKLHDIKTWFMDLRAKCQMSIEEIPLVNCNGWFVDENTGNISHISGDFFKLQGLRIDFDEREVGSGGWDQPILTQVGFDGGLLGIIKQRFEGIPHYLIEAKAEPGNYKKIQLSPTLQATFSNLKKAHNGVKPLFSNFFENPEEYDVNVIYDKWLSEDGGRFYLKRNKGMMIEVPENTISNIPNNFIWLSMWQIKQLLIEEDAWINPHIRGIISHL